MRRKCTNRFPKTKSLDRSNGARHGLTRFSRMAVKTRNRRIMYERGLLFTKDGHRARPSDVSKGGHGDK